MFYVHVHGGAAHDPSTVGITGRDVPKYYLSGCQYFCKPGKMCLNQTMLRSDVFKLKISLIACSRKAPKMSFSESLSSPATEPEVRVAMAGLCLELTLRRTLKRRPSLAMAKITRGIGNMDPSRLCTHRLCYNSNKYIDPIHFHLFISVSQTFKSLSNETARICLIQEPFPIILFT